MENNTDWLKIEGGIHFVDFIHNTHSIYRYWVRCPLVQQICCFAFSHCSKHQTINTELVDPYKYVEMLLRCTHYHLPKCYVSIRSKNALDSVFYEIFRGSYDGSEREGGGEIAEFATGRFPRTPSTTSIIFRKRTDGERAHVDLFLFFLRQYKITDRYA